MKTPAEKAMKKALQILRNDPLLFRCVVEDALRGALRTPHSSGYLAEIDELADLVDLADRE